MDGHTKIWTPMLDVVGSHVSYVVAYAQDNGGPSRISGRVLWTSTMLSCGLPRSFVDDHSKPFWASTSGNLDDHHALVGNHQWPRVCVGWAYHTPWRATRQAFGHPRGFWVPILCCGRSGVALWSPSVLCEPPRVCVGGHELRVVWSGCARGLVGARGGA